MLPGKARPGVPLPGLSRGFILTFTACYAINSDLDALSGLLKAVFPPASGGFRLNDLNLSVGGRCALLISVLAFGAGAPAFADMSDLTLSLAYAPDGASPFGPSLTDGVGVVDMPESRIKPVPFAPAAAGSLIADGDMTSPDESRVQPFVGRYCPAKEAGTPVVHMLPDCPSSAVLFLWAVASYGATCLGRSVRQARLGDIEWRHPGGLTQVDLASAISVNCHSPVLAMPNDPVGDRLIGYHLRREPSVRGEDQFFLMVEAPRGPPRLPF